MQGLSPPLLPVLPLQVPLPPELRVQAQVRATGSDPVLVPDSVLESGRASASDLVSASGPASVLDLASASGPVSVLGPASALDLVLASGLVSA